MPQALAYHVNERLEGDGWISRRRDAQRIDWQHVRLVDQPDDHVGRCWRRWCRREWRRRSVAGQPVYPTLVAYAFMDDALCCHGRRKHRWQFDRHLDRAGRQANAYRHQLLSGTSSLPLSAVSIKKPSELYWPISDSISGACLLFSFCPFHRFFLHLVKSKSNDALCTLSPSTNDHEAFYTLSFSTVITSKKKKKDFISILSYLHSDCCRLYVL